MNIITIISDCLSGLILLGTTLGDEIAELESFLVWSGRQQRK